MSYWNLTETCAIAPAVVVDNNGLLAEPAGHRSNEARRETDELLVSLAQRNKGRVPTSANFIRFIVAVAFGLVSVAPGQAGRRDDDTETATDEKPSFYEDTRNYIVGSVMDAGELLRNFTVYAYVDLVEGSERRGLDAVERRVVMSLLPVQDLVKVVQRSLEKNRVALRQLLEQAAVPSIKAPVDGTEQTPNAFDSVIADLRANDADVRRILSNIKELRYDYLFNLLIDIADVTNNAYPQFIASIDEAVETLFLAIAVLSGSSVANAEQLHLWFLNQLAEHVATLAVAAVDHSRQETKRRDAAARRRLDDNNDNDNDAPDSTAKRSRKVIDALRRGLMPAPRQ